MSEDPTAPYFLTNTPRPGETPEQIAAEHQYDLALVRKVARMVERSEYKRQQAAPGIKITEKAFGMGRRFPIAQKSDV